MAHTDMFIMAPIVFWLFLSFWFIYVLVTAYFFPLIYKFYRIRSLASKYFNSGFYLQILSVVRFNIVFNNTTSNLFKLATRIIDFNFSLLKIKLRNLFNKQMYVNRRNIGFLVKDYEN